MKKCQFAFLLILILSIMGCRSTINSEINSLSTEDQFLPNWADEHLDELGYYNDISDHMIQEYLDMLVQEGFHELSGYGNDFDPQVKLFIRDDAWVSIMYPYYDNWYKKTLGYHITVLHQRNSGSISSSKAASIMKRCKVNKEIVAMLEDTPENLGNECKLQVFQCILRVSSGYIRETFLVGKKSILQLQDPYMIAYTTAEGDFSEKVVVLMRDYERFENFFNITIRTMSSKEGNPAASNVCWFRMDPGRISLNVHGEKIYFVHERRKVPVEPQKPFEYEPAKEYEIVCSDGTISILDPRNELNVYELGPPQE